MATLADYLALQSASFTLSDNQEKTLSFSLGTIFADNSGKRRPILAFMLDSSSNASNLSVVVEINAKLVKSLTISGDKTFGLWEIFGSDTLNIDGSNTIQFRVESGIGSVTFSDVILWFQQEV